MLLPLLLAVSLWTPVIDREAAAAHVPASLVRAVVAHESGGRADAVGPAPYRCLGLMQVCPRVFRVCAGELYDSAPCAALRASLLDGGTNLHVGTGMLAAWTRYCRATTGHAEPRHILSGYGGTDGHGVVCGQRRTADGWEDAPVPRIVAEILALAQP